MKIVAALAVTFMSPLADAQTLYMESNCRRTEYVSSYSSMALSSTGESLSRQAVFLIAKFVLLTLLNVV